MKNRKVWRFIFVFLIAGLTAACGRKENGTETEEDYGYLSSKIPFPDDVNHLQIVGEDLYYIRHMTGEAAVCRAPVESVLNGISPEEVSGQEILAGVSYAAFRMPDGNKEILTDTDFSALLDGNESSEKDGAEEEKEYCWLYLTEYAFDRERNLYYSAAVSVGRVLDREDAGMLLSKQTAEGDIVYRRYLQEMEGFAVDFEGRSYILTGNDIMILDERGEKISSITVDKYRKEDALTSGKMMSDSEGRVFCFFGGGDDGEERFEIVESKTFSGDWQFELIETGSFPKGSYYMASEGNVLINSDRENVLYEYNREKGTVEALLRWGESNMTGQYVESVAVSRSDILLVNYRFSGEAGVYQLIRTKRSEMPEKKQLILASLNPSPALEQAVASFNGHSSTYTIVIMDYGRNYSEAEGEWQSPRLDAELASSTPPDILDLHLLNLSKYAGQGILEDLEDYLEKSRVLDRDDYLENILEGMTFDGKLICIPKAFDISYAAGRAAQIGSTENWTMERLYELTERYPESGSGVINDGYGAGVERGYLLEEFCSAYYLEEFVDWDNAKCSFDSDAFGRLIAWAGECAGGQEPEEHFGGTRYFYPVEVPDDALLVVQPYISVFSREYLDLLCGEETVMTGFPTSDGKGCFRGSVKDALGIVSRSEHKDVAWEFLEYYLGESENMGVIGGLPSHRSELGKLFENVTEFEYEDSENGDKREMKIKSNYFLGEDRIPIYSISEEQAAAVMEVIEKADFSPVSEEERRIIRIVTEEAESYYHGDKSLEEVTETIQNRVQLMLDES